MAAMVGSNLNHDVGYLDFGRTGSLEMIVISNEIIDQARRIQRGIPVDDDQLALPAIRDAGAEGQLLTHEHTVKHLRDTQWRPQIFSRMGLETWEENGSQSLLDRARLRLAEIVDKHQAPAIPPEMQREIQNRVDQFKGR
jgi:trimethylamine--corrinoid protein Co-methyltransferase